MRTTQERLARLHNCATRYELTLRHADGRAFLVQYTPRNNRRGLCDCVASMGEHIARITGETQYHTAKRAADGATLGAWTIRFSGRTQREAIISGELPFVADAT